MMPQVPGSLRLGDEKSPVLFLIFNRPIETSEVFSRIREYRPRKLFIAADGPRSNSPDDQELCAETKLIIERIDWDCKINTLFREDNLGCKRAVESAISWFFEHVQEGIILEDDCVPHGNFFHFCHELLVENRHNEKIALIAGFNPIDSRDFSHEYRYSSYAGIWGWATWKRAWEHYSPTFDGLADFLDSARLNQILNSPEEAAYWSETFLKESVQNQRSWAYPWLYSWWRRGAKGILPTVNLVSNIGFGAAATHTKAFDTTLACRLKGEILFPLRMAESDDVLNFDHEFAQRVYLHPSENEILSTQTPRHGWLKHIMNTIQRFIS